VEAAKKAIKKAGSPALVHCDAVQGFCKVSVRPEKLGVDLLTISSHKIHGPKGAGALYVRNGAHILPMLFGGGQEKGMRSGTEAVPAIAGFGEAARLAYQNMGETESITSSLRNYCIERLSQIPGVIINSPASGSHAENMNSVSAEKIAAANCSGTAYCPITTTPQYAPHILNISVLGIRSETMLHFLESEGIFVSSGSACSKGAKSHVLSSMKLSNEIIDSALRISFCRYNTIDEINALIEAVERGSARLVKQ
jgi:cysteine desulfurase